MSYGGRLTKDIQTNIYTFPSMLRLSQLLFQAGAEMRTD